MNFHHPTIRDRRALARSARWTEPTATAGSWSSTGAVGGVIAASVWMARPCCRTRNCQRHSRSSSWAPADENHTHSVSSSAITYRPLSVVSSLDLDQAIRYRLRVGPMLLELRVQSLDAERIHAKAGMRTARLRRSAVSESVRSQLRHRWRRNGLTASTSG